MTIIPFPKPYLCDRRDDAYPPGDDEFETVRMYAVAPGPTEAKILQGVGEAVRGVLALEEVFQADPERVLSLGTVDFALRDIGDRVLTLLGDIERRKWMAALKLGAESCD